MGEARRLDTFSMTVDDMEGNRVVMDKKSNGSVEIKDPSRFGVF